VLKKTQTLEIPRGELSNKDSGRLNVPAKSKTPGIDS
jgi:hypothetical protein